MILDSVNLTSALAQVTQAHGELQNLRVNLQPMRALKASVARGKLAALSRKPRLIMATFQLGDLELEQDVPQYGFPVELELCNFDSFELLRESGLTPDIALFRSHQFWQVDGNYNIQGLANAPHFANECLNLVWLWDHHHTFELSGKMALLADIVLPMHETGADYLKCFNDMVFSAVPAASAQWGGPRLVDAVFRENAAIERSNRLYGGFVGYPGFHRNQFVSQCMAAFPDHALVLLPPTHARDIRHFGVASRRERLIEWMSYKCSLVCALTEDIPIRIIDGLLAGQIPLVPNNLNGFDRLISPALQAELPIVRYDPYDVPSVEAAWRTAIRLYDRAGPAGAALRHRYALANHMPKHRLADIVMTVLNNARIFADP